MDEKNTPTRTGQNAFDENIARAEEALKDIADRLQGLKVSRAKTEALGSDWSWVADAAHFADELEILAGSAESY